MLRLVEQFTLHRDSHTQAGYNETQLRREFLDPFFEALGWDIDNTPGLRRGLQGCDPRGRHQDRRRDEGPGLLLPRSAARGNSSSRRRSPRSTSRTTRPRPISFAATPGPPGCRCPSSPTSRSSPSTTAAIKPDHTDQASARPLLYFTFRDYARPLGRVRRRLRPGGRPQRLLRPVRRIDARRREARPTVDDAFLAEIESWRDLLARNIALGTRQPHPAGTERRRAR